ncbi:hypothetical protein [Parablautia muri]|uniref:Uncharacterized protein n=1 Tax=Parablautia muri TaxID=2320879 RepID=A0A9X5BGG4_9FIRM|nr:hypothetical protein [Parablautia muri]NBJ93223.1 hypothetical protein [Parablautia muri]
MGPEDAIEIIKKMHKGVYTTNQFIALSMAYDALGKETCDRCDGCKNDGVECMHCMRAYSDCYED